MVVFQRKIYQDLLEWKENSAGKSALLIEGARRVGKSTMAEEFAKREYEDYLLLDFSKASSDIKRNFEENIGDLTTFFRNLALLTRKDLPRGSLIIFDEVQLFPLARQAIKHLVKNGRYQYLETGSLISIKENVKDILIPSEEESLQMVPMDFEEFLWATGNTVTMPAIREAFEHRKPLGDAIHRKIMEQFRTYMAVGGMPQAVEAYVAGKSYQQIDRVKREILHLYEGDLRKYDKTTQGRAAAVFRSLPQQLSGRNAHFTYAKVEKGSRAAQYVDTMHWIDESGMANICCNVTDPQISLDLFADPANIKLYMGDTGLLVTQIFQSEKSTGDDIYKALIFNKLGINQGMIMENVVSQMLKANGHGLYFHEYEYQAEGNAKPSKYEIDFLLVKDKGLCPIEVKSSAYRNHKSFDYFGKKYPIKLRDQYIIYTKDLKTDDKLCYIPLYMTLCL